jgi:DNA-binding MarR family transcriptional regulator
MPSRRLPPPQELAMTASEVTDLLAVLWGKARAQAPAGPISPSQLRALLAIERSQGSNLRALGEALESSPPATSRLCDRLEAAGLVERYKSPASRREVELHLSKQGQELLDEVRGHQVREIRKVLEIMPADALAHLTMGLVAFRDAAASAAGGTADADTNGTRAERTA